MRICDYPVGIGGVSQIQYPSSYGKITLFENRETRLHVQSSLAQVEMLLLVFPTICWPATKPCNIEFQGALSNTA